MTGHAVLQIVKGIPRIPNNPNQTEIGLDTIDFLDTSGFSLIAYDQKIPALKSSAVFADSPISNGRRLISGAQGNVTETLTFTVSASAIPQLAAMLSKLFRFKQDCNDYWDTKNQIEPIYIKHQVSGEIGARYSILYDIDVAIDTNIDPNETMRSVTVVIERDTAWLGEVAPGDNPNRWIRFVQKQKWTIDGGDIRGSNATFPPFFREAFVDNKSEWVSSGYASLLTNNAIKIPATSIPGDMDALTTLVISQTNQNLNLFVGKKTVNPPVFSSLAPAQVITPPNGIFNANDGTLGLNATLANDTGAPRAAGAGTAQRVEIGFGTAANSLRLNFPATATGKLNRFIGQWMVFMRCRQVNGASGDITMYLRYGFDITGNADGIAMPLQIPQVTGTSGATSGWGLTYMGTMSIPFVGDAKGTVGEASGSGAGYGLDGGETNLDIGLFAARSTGVGVLYVSDLILIPYDEAAFNIKPLDSVIGTRVIVDNTTYFTHGIPGDYHFQPGTPNALTQFSGNSITLTPGVDNYIYLIGADNSLLSTVSNQFTIVMHIIPRWQYLRSA